MEQEKNKFKISIRKTTKAEKYDFILGVIGVVLICLIVYAITKFLGQ